MADRRSEPVVVIGLGRFGGSLALELVKSGTEVMAIDSEARVVESMAGKLTHVVTADSTDIEALQQLGVADFYRAVVAIGTDMEASILTTSLLSELKVEDIWAKAVSKQHGRILERVGADHVVFPEHDMGERVAHLVSGRMLDYVEVEEDYALIKAKPPKDLVGRSLGETRLRSKWGLTVVSVKSPGEPFTYATAETVLAYDDLIILAGKINDLERFSELL